MNKLYPACALALASLCMAFAPAASAADLQGQVVFQPASDGSAAPDAADTVIFYKPDMAPRVLPQQGDVTMTMANKSFVPHVLAVTQGTRVRFPNSDPIFHNIFSPSAPNDFDLGLYDTSAGKVKQFDHPGLVHVYCNVHRDMFGYIIVLDTPYYVGTRTDGGFDLRNLPAGVGQLIVWNPRTQVWRQRVSVTDAMQRLNIQLVTMPGGVPDHLNKDGKPYFHHRTPGT